MPDYYTRNVFTRISYKLRNKEPLDKIEGIMFIFGVIVIVQGAFNYLYNYDNGKVESKDKSI